ncbi:hypothetical protein C8Q76DRAFT_799066 [Earliella scabrosa]|nr:hypothetical protein C8Q76DRAFT_800587 [Earliella scabrosa]KAI0709030.1 hypothetical protein C8Q76DRAFT_799066 [Earliella scabrosa]
MVRVVQPTKAQLAALVDELTAQIAAANIDRETNAITLAEIQATLQQQTTALHAAQARAEAAEADAAAANAAATTAAAAAPAPPVDEPIVPKPAGSRFNIRNAMGVSYNEYCAIRATIHILVKASQLKWKEDFRRQDPQDLALFFRAARKEHPILKKYANNWAAAAIARTYMQNMRKHARKQGYIPPHRRSSST